MNEFRNREAPSKAEIAADWDRLADVRAEDIDAGRDISYSLVLTPTILELLSAVDARTVLDVGCGTGRATEMLAARAEFTLGLDPSSRSVARAQAQPSHRAKYLVGWIDEFAEATSLRFDVVVANMSLSSMTDLRASLSSMRAVLKSRGSLIATIPHPWFWATYWGYDSAPWFDYSTELFIEAGFRISQHSTDLRSVHVHRPLEQYVTDLRSTGFRLDEVAEPWPSADVERLYPAAWRFPRFLAFRARLDPT